MKKKKWRDIRNALVMTLVMVAMMSTATYAWFTLSSSPTVTGMEMVAASTSGLTVSTAVDGQFLNAIKLGVDNMNLPAGGVEGDLLRLVPVAIKDGAFHLPAYENDKVSGLEGDPLADLVGHVAVYTYYIKSDKGTVDVGIITGDSTANLTEEMTVENNQASLAGTMVRRKLDPNDQSQGAGNASENATYSIRMGVVVTGPDDTPDIADMIILEPNNDGVLDNTNLKGAAVADGVVTDSDIDTKVSFKKAGTITSADPTSTTTSQALFQVGETPSKVTMYYWLEGNDPQCVDEIKTDQLEAQIQFTVIQ